MPGATAVDRMYEESQAALLAIPENQPSIRSSTGDLFRKTLLLASASYFEHQLTQSVLAYVEECSAGSSKLIALVQAKAITRQYHTWFDWRLSNANKFFALFGEEFKDAVTSHVKGNDELRQSIQSFMELGNSRNEMVHENFATFTLEKTLDEVYAAYKKALVFVDGVGDLLRKHP